MASDKIKHMIRWIGVLLLATLTLPTFAQINKPKNRFMVGGNVAPQLAVILNQNNYGYAELDYRAKIGYQVGAKIGYEWNIYNQIEAGLTWTTLGQSYRDVISNVVNEKVVALRYIYVPIIYRRILGYRDQWSNNIGTSNFYLMAGVQPGRLLGAEVQWDKAGRPVDMITYLTENGNNINETVLRSMGAPEQDVDLFERNDFMGLLGVGMQYWPTAFTSINLEMKNAVGFSDINAEIWRLPNRKGVYEPSRNAYVALNIVIQAFF